MKIEISNELIYERIKSHYTGAWKPYEAYLYNDGYIDALTDMDSNLQLENFTALNVSEFNKYKSLE